MQEIYGNNPKSFLLLTPIFKQTIMGIGDRDEEILCSLCFVCF